MPVQWLALGDSYTSGEGITPEACWTHQLARALRNGGIDIAAPRTIATTGWTTDELAAGIAAEQPLGTFDFVTLGVGVNDQYRGRSSAEYRAQLMPLLDTALGLAGAGCERMLMISIPDWGVTRFARSEGRDGQAVAREIDEFNDVARGMCEARRIAFVDITADSRDGGDGDSMLVADGLHPAAAMHARWADRVLPVARDLLAAQ